MKTKHTSDQLWSTALEGGGEIWAGHLAVTTLNMNSSVYQGHLGPNLVMQQDNNPMLSAHICTTEWLQNKRIKMLQWSSQSPSLNST